MKRIKDKKNKLKKGLLLAGLAGASIALLSQPALAAKKGKTYHEEEWKKTKTYGNTLIAEDSANEWGPWKAFIQPAAGPLAIAPMPGMRADGSDYYRPETVEEYSPKYTLDQGACQSGAWCGYMAYDSYSSGGEGDGVEQGPRPGLIRLYLSPDDPSGVDTDGTASYTVVNLYAPGAGTVHGSGELPGEFYEGRSNFDVGDSGGESGEGYYDYYGNWIEGYYPVDWEEAGRSTAGWAWDYQYGGVDNGEWWEYYDSGFGGPFVAGITTSLAEMANFGGVTEANYYGHTPDHGTPVDITVNFNQATWSGSWNDGVDGSHAPHQNIDSDGNKYMTGHVGFNAAGTITGSNIQSTSIWADDGTIDQAKSTVVGSFFGTGAEVLGGVSDITKSKVSDNMYDEGNYTDVRNVDIFVTCAGNECINYDD